MAQQQVQQQSVPATKRPVYLEECLVVWVKFNFTNPNHVPPGIMRMDRRPDDHILDRDHAHKAMSIGRPDLAEVGRHREGRVDTGEKVHENVQQTQLAFLRRGMANNGMKLGRCRWYIHQVPGRQTKFVVELGFTHNPQAMLTLTRQQEDALRALARDAVWTSHIWANPDDTCTVNMVQRQPGVPPKNAVVVRDGKLTVVEVSKLIEEAAE